MDNDEYLLENIDFRGNEEILKKYSSLNKQDPYSSSGFFQRLFVTWALNIVKLSNYLSLKPQYFGHLPQKFESKHYYEEFKNVWFNKNYKNRKYLPLIQAGFVSNKLYAIFAIIGDISISMTDIIRVSLFREIMSRFSHNNCYGIYKYFSQTQMVFLYILNRIVRTLCFRKCYEYETILRYRLTSQYQCLIFEKLLKVSPSSTGPRADNGQIFNFIQVDAYQLNKLMNLTPDLIFVPFQIFLFSLMLFGLLGWIYFIGITILIAFILANMFFQKKIKELSKKNMQFKDKRMKITSETFNNIKILKLYSWENAFKNKIKEAREEELLNMENNYKIENINSMIQWFGPLCSSLISFGLFQYFKGDFKIEDIFTSLNIFQKIQSPLKYIPRLLNNFYETVIATERIEKFLRQDEINPNNLIKNTSENNIKIKIENGNFSWGLPPSEASEEKQKSSKEIDLQSKTKRKKEQNIKNKKEKKIYQEIELTEKITIPDEENTENTNTNNDDSEYLKLEQNDTLDETENININDKKNNIISISDNNTLKPVLKNINIEIFKGEFVCIIGEVGSGKSSLFHSILNCLIPISNSSKIYVNDSIGYTSQIPWIQNKTIRDNILFYNKYDKEKYNKILDITCLKADLKILEAGDLTEIGEKGVNLSGGQKTRISLARALYSDKEIYIFDDPLSSLDVDVGMEIMKKCILDYLKDKTVIVSTNALQYLEYCDKIIYMKEGEIAWVGKYEEIIKKDFFIYLYEKYLKEKNKNNIKEEQNPKKENYDNNKSMNKGIVKRITKDEEIEKKIKMSLISSLISNIGGNKALISIIFFVITIQIFKMQSDIWLGYWSSHQTKENKTRNYLIYAFLCLCSFTFNYCLLNTKLKSTLIVSKRVHDLMINNLILAPISSYHETVPKGQIFNRLTKDLNNVDTESVDQVEELINVILSFTLSVSLCSYYQPYCLFLCPILFYLGQKWTQFNSKCFRELYRIEGIVRAPLLNIINEAIPGTIIIRVFECQKEFIDKYFKSIDENFKIRIILNGVNNLYDLILDSLSAILASCILIFCLIYKDKFEATQIGLLIINYENIHVKMISGLHTLRSFKNTLVEYERCMELVEIPKEKSVIKKLDGGNFDKNSENWLKNGKIEFKNFSVKYRKDTELVLKNINILINPGEKIGIVGRTGSGKSTITLCLFRLLEAFEGEIYIDDIDISGIPLEILRKNITIIPQDPVLISGTLRFNIDPFNYYTDNNIIEVLKKINFECIIKENPLGLEQIIAEEGANLSVGERQLICIARAILRNSKIIVMDEATASIDYKTEEIIQNCINEVLNKSTIITIAHRIKTILKYDRIISLDNGEIKEFDTPENLLKNKEGIFYNLYYKSNLK